MFLCIMKSNYDWEYILRLIDVINLEIEVVIICIRLRVGYYCSYKFNIW